MKIPALGFVLSLVYASAASARAEHLWLVAGGTGIAGVGRTTQNILLNLLSRKPKKPAMLAFCLTTLPECEDADYTACKKGREYADFFAGVAGGRCRVFHHGV